MEQCIFCRILRHEAPASLVYEDNQCIAFMDINQPNPYKVLVIPREHIETLFDLTDAQGEAMMRATLRVARAIRAVSGCDGLNVFQNNGITAGQEVLHFHIHLLPRFASDGTPWRNPRPTSRDELDSMATALRVALANSDD
ncbi:MAG: HIT family protein [Chloroflexi bacterium]|nr:HIT family protein [Chloroflexota bacterium]